MKCIKKRIYAIMSAAAVSSALAVSLSSSANTVVRDANGDGLIRMNDAVITTQYLMGKYNPTNVKSFDFDGNNVISAMDSMKIQQYLLGNISETNLPSPSNEVTNAASSTIAYLRHDCSDDIKHSFTEYSLTVNLLDNTTQNSTSPRSIIGENDMVTAADETAVVKLVNSTTNEHIGSGFIVGDHIVATAAHCVCTDTNEFSDITMNIVNENNNIIRTLQPEYIHVAKDAIYNTNLIRGNSDYALLYFDESLSQYGVFQMGVATDEYRDQHGRIVVSGFPGIYPPNYSGPVGNIRFKASGNLYYSTDDYYNSVPAKNKYRFFYDADTYGGDSGGPVYVDEAFYAGGQWYTYKTVIGIHTASTVNSTPGYQYCDSNYNSGVRITPDLLKFYYENTYLTD